MLLQHLQSILIWLPKRALLFGIVDLVGLAFEGLGELVKVGGGAHDAELARRMLVGHDSRDQTLISVLAAPDLPEVYEKQLILGEVQAGQQLLRSVLSHPSFVGLKETTKIKSKSKNRETLNNKITLNDCLMPPLSAMFSLFVWKPFNLDAKLNIHHTKFTFLLNKNSKLLFCWLVLRDICCIDLWDTEFSFCSFRRFFLIRSWLEFIMNKRFIDLIYYLFVQRPVEPSGK